MGVKWELTSCARASDDRAQSEGGVRGVGEVEGGGGLYCVFVMFQWWVTLIEGVRRCRNLLVILSHFGGIKPLDYRLYERIFAMPTERAV